MASKRVTKKLKKAKKLQPTKPLEYLGSPPQLPYIKR